MASTDLTLEPKLIRVSEDTWKLGIHSYLTNTYLRNGRLLARDLLIIPKSAVDLCGAHPSVVKTMLYCLSADWHPRWHTKQHCRRGGGLPRREKTLRLHP